MAQVWREGSLGAHPYHLSGLVLNAAAGAWRADPLAGYVIVCYGAREALSIFRDHG